MAGGVRIIFVPRHVEGTSLRRISGAKLELERLGAGMTAARPGAPQPAELVFHAAFLTKARRVSEPTFTQFATLAGELMLDEARRAPVFVCDPAADFDYAEPEPDGDEPVRRLALDYDALSFRNRPPATAPSRKLRLPLEPEGSTFLEIGAELKLAGAVEASLALNHRLDLPLGPVEALTTTLPLDQLAGIARVFRPNHFVSWLTMIFGEDVPHAAYLRLRTEVVSNGYRMPPIKIVSSLPGGFLAGYDKETKEIKVQRAFVRSAETDDEQAALLLTALVEEFGHFIDDDLRTRLSKVGGDASFDEGALFGHSALNLGWDLTDNAEFAVYLREEEPVPLRVRWPEYRRAIEEALGPEEQRTDDVSVALEFFGAASEHGKPGQSFTHETIEIDGLPSEFSTALKREIYFGNWLRDYSQALTKISLEVIAAGAKYVDSVVPGKAGVPKLVTDPRVVITDMLDIYARAKFADVPQFRVTKARLGVYRAEEHIDNPFGIKTSKLEPALNPAPSNDQLNIDPVSQVAHYITKRLPPPAVSAVEYMRAELAAAIAAGPTAEGRRRFGQGLHTLEDFYAHSNFCELGLRAAGKTTVEPWVPRRKGAGGDFFPLVTGCFGGDDTAASIFLAIGEMLEAEIGQKCVAGKRSIGVTMALIVLRGIRPHIADSIDATLKRFERLQQEHPRFATAWCATAGVLIRFANFLIGTVIRFLANQIDELQLKLDPGVTVNPTHTQLAKDHDDHPLHLLASGCARLAVGDIGRQMLTIWTQGVTDARREQLLNRAESYFQHPDLLFVGPQTPELGAVVNELKAFANNPANAGAIARASTRSVLDSHLKEAKEFAERATKAIELERLKKIFDLF